MIISRPIYLLFVLVLVMPGLSACVSTKVNQQDFAEPLPAHVDPQARANAVAEIHEKAANTGDTKPSAYASDDSTTEPKSEAEIATMKQEMEQAKKQQVNTITDEEVAAKKREFDALRAQAQSHYENTVSSIEN